MPHSLLMVPLAAAVAAASPPSHRYGHLFVSPMGEPFRAADRGDALRTWFNQADQNHDGVLTIKEMQADAQRFFATLDTNHDGEIDPDEITRYEEVVAPGVRMGLLDLPEPVVAADTDLNRGVSLEEFRKAAERRFQALDVDHEGRLTTALLESLRPAAPAREKHQDAPEGEDSTALPPEFAGR
jgi:Ca2+-binding EF-hand superfamily protein